MRWGVYGTEMVVAVLLAAMLLAAPACTVEPSQLVVRIDSDIPDLGSVRIRVQEDSEGSPRADEGVYAPPTPQRPLVVGVAPPRDDPARSVVLRVEGIVADEVVVERIARVGFVRGQTLLLRIFLAESCVGLSCPEGFTCDRQVCIDEVVPVDSLPVIEAGEEQNDPRRDATTSVRDSDAGLRDAASVAEGGADASRPVDASLPDAPAWSVDASLPVDASPPDPPSVDASPGDDAGARDDAGGASDAGTVGGVCETCTLPTCASDEVAAAACNIRTEEGPERCGPLQPVASSFEITLPEDLEPSEGSAETHWARIRFTNVSGEEVTCCYQGQPTGDDIFTFRACFAGKATCHLYPGLVGMELALGARDAVEVTELQLAVLNAGDDERVDVKHCF